MITWYVLCSWWPHLRVTKFFFSLTSVSFIIEVRLADRGWRWDLDRQKCSACSQIYYEIRPSFFGDERPASHELSRCSWIGAAKPVAWLRSKPPIMSKLQKLSRAELSRAPATLIVHDDVCAISQFGHFLIEKGVTFFSAAQKVRYSARLAAESFPTLFGLLCFLFT